MGEAESAASGGDPQRLKRIAAAAYDYDSDPRWSEYWSNVLVPPHLASRPDVADHFKRKFYQRFIDPDLVVEPMSSTSSTQTARPSARSSSTSSSENARARDSGIGSGARSAAQPPPPERASNSLRLDGRSIHFSINAWVLAVAVLGILPIAPKHLASKAYRISLLGTICSSLYSLYNIYGKPRAWNMPAVQMWLQSIIGAKDFIHLMFSLMLFTSQLHFKIALIPVLCWALDHVARFLRRNFTRSSLYRRYLEEPCLWVETKNTTLSILSSNAEIALGFLLIISLFSWQRNIIQTFMYWNLLKLMYHAPVTALVIFYTAVEAHVSCSCDCWLSPERVGKNRPGSKSIHLPLCSIPFYTSFCNSKMVVPVEDMEDGFVGISHIPYTKRLSLFHILRT